MHFWWIHTFSPTGYHTTFQTSHQFKEYLNSWNTLKRGGYEWQVKSNESDILLHYWHAGHQPNNSILTLLGLGVWQRRHSAIRKKWGVFVVSISKHESKQQHINLTSDTANNDSCFTFQDTPEMFRHCILKKK